MTREFIEEYLGKANEFRLIEMPKEKDIDDTNYVISYDELEVVISEYINPVSHIGTITTNAYGVILKAYTDDDIVSFIQVLKKVKESYERNVE